DRCDYWTASDPCVVHVSEPASTGKWPRRPALRGPVGVAASATKGLAEPKLAQQAEAGGGGRTRTYEGVSQRIYSPPPLPLGTLPRSRTSHPADAMFWPGYGERLAWCQPRRSRLYGIATGQLS